MSLLDHVSAVLPAGFYYKTFMGPVGSWMLYEPFIRRAAGMGVAPADVDPDRYEKRYAHCDVLVVGGGPAGLMAALAAGRTGARVILCDEQPMFGGRLLGERTDVAGGPASAWIDAVIEELESLSAVELCGRTTAFGRYDHNLVGLMERTAAEGSATRQRLWLVRAREIVIAAGAIERPMVFGGNDRPGIMLASAAQTYVNRFSALPGRRAIVLTNNDSAYVAARDLIAAGIDIPVLVDLRPQLPPAAAALQDSGVECLADRAVVSTAGRRALDSVELSALSDDGTGTIGTLRTVDADLLCVSGGWSPTVHLYCQAGGKLTYDPDLAALVPRDDLPGLRIAGAARGDFALADCLLTGATAGTRAAACAGFGDGVVPTPPAVPNETQASPRPLWVLPAGRRRQKRFVDLQNDVTVEDIELAVREGYRSVEHVKRYTTLGMGPDPGRTSNVNGLGILAAVLGRTIDRVGTTTFRPPYAPVTMGALAGREVGRRLRPIRRSPLHEWHVGSEAVMRTAGLWLRPHHYPLSGETAQEAINREARNVRENVGLVDVSTLGRIDIQGSDVAVLLDRVYVNGWTSLEVGKVRYGVMLREDGMVFDDGTTARLADNHFVMTTTTAQAGPVMATLEYWLQVAWPELDVSVVSVTDQWAVMAIAGPNSRRVLESVSSDFDLSNAAFPFMAWRRGRLAGLDATVFRISFSGELAYEVAVPAGAGAALWRALLEAGRSHGMMPYGTEALTVLRVEKGHFVMGPEADGRVTLEDLGLSRLQSRKKDYVGRLALSRPAMVATGRRQLVGLLSSDGAASIPAGAQIVDQPAASPPVQMLGHVTTAVFSPNLNRPIALAMVAGGRDRHGQTLFARAPLNDETVAVTVTGSIFVDPDGARLRG